MIDIFESFDSEKSFREWEVNCNLSTESIEESIIRIRQNGIKSKFFGDIKGSELVVTGKNYREQLKVKGLNSRQRALLEILVSEGIIISTPSPRIYAPEAVTCLAANLRFRYPYFIGSEYAPSHNLQEKIYPISHQDLSNLTLETGSFDAVISCDVLEHVPEIKSSLSEMARILKKGGVMLSTHPFTWVQKSIIKARFLNNTIIYDCEPEYHGNPIDPAGGSLVFTIPGFEIVNWCIGAGFSRAEMIIISSEEMGILSTGPQFLNVLRAYK